MIVVIIIVNIINMIIILIIIIITITFCYFYWLPFYIVWLPLQSFRAVNYAMSKNPWGRQATEVLFKSAATCNV